MIREQEEVGGAKDRLQQGLLTISFFNLVVVSLLGILLRSFPFLSSFPLEYKNILHGHSHFAFGGWVMPVLLSLVMKSFPFLKESIAYRHWRNIAVLVLLSAYGMLASFPIQGYGPVSILFSTVSILATVYLATMIWKVAAAMKQTASIKFFKWGLLYACLSAIGPFATGPLIVMGKGGSPLYFDAIYFYLHFQYNGFFTFTVLALLYRLIEQQGYKGFGQKVFHLFNAACLPAYALSALWNEPSVVFNFVGGAGAVLQLAGLLYLLKDVAATKLPKRSLLLRLSLSAFVLKNVLQFLSAFPSIALMAYHNRNFVIAYLHLVLLGFVSLFVFGLAVKANRYSRTGIRLFLFSFVTTEVLLVLNASSGMLHVDMPYYVQMLWFFSSFFPVGIALMIWGLNRDRNLQTVYEAAKPLLKVSLPLHERRL
jgi:hypothetical protein